MQKLRAEIFLYFRYLTFILQFPPDHSTSTFSSPCAFLTTKLILTEHLFKFIVLSSTTVPIT
uniref:Uncharacterized protein n=1 Tax=Ascaris lumbricoides TaxID=6252 RepID=A0A0M3HI48_ASCLU